MHYKNGREAKNGDKVMFIPEHGGSPVIGVLYNATQGNDYCNGYLAPMTNQVCPNLKECLRLDDAMTMIATAPMPKPE